MGSFTMLAVMYVAFLLSKRRAKVSAVATANVRIVAFLAYRLVRANTQISRALLRGCFVVGGPNRDLYRWIRGIWLFPSRGVYGKAPDDIDMSVDPSLFTFLGDEFMRHVCDYIVYLLDGQTLLGELIHASWSGPDSGTYKINIQWGEFTGDAQIVIDLSQFKSENNGEVELKASIKDDAFRRDLTFNALYTPLYDMFAHVNPCASENIVWFGLLVSTLIAFCRGNVLDPTGSGLFALHHDVIDLCGVRCALLNRARLLGLDLSSSPNTANILSVLQQHGV